MTEPLEFLRALRPGGPWQLVGFPPDRVGPKRGCRAVTPEQVEQFIANYHRRNIYYHINLPFASTASKPPRRTSAVSNSFTPIWTRARRDPADAKKALRRGADGERSTGAKLLGR